MHAQLGQSVAAKAAAERRLQKEVDRLREVHQAALSAGTFGRGRALLVEETLREPKRRVGRQAGPSTPLSYVADAPPDCLPNAGSRSWPALARAPAGRPWSASGGVLEPGGLRARRISWRPAEELDAISLATANAYVEQMGAAAGPHLGLANTAWLPGTTVGMNTAADDEAKAPLRGWDS